MASPKLKVTQKRTFELDEVDADGLMVFRQEWCAAKDGDLEFEVYSGAGLGHPYLIAHVKKGDVTVYRAIDIQDLINPWIRSIESEISNEQS